MSAAAEPSEQEEGTIRIPVATFINDVEEFLSSSNKTPEEAIKQLNSDYQIYKTVESQLLHKKTRLMTKVPDLNRALDMVVLLIEKQGEEMTVDYSLADQIHASAKLKDVTSVKLWLGADVMLEYGLEEAKKVLEENLEVTKQNLESNKNDLELMKDYATTAEVSIARIYNYDIATRRKGEKPGQSTA